MKIFVRDADLMQKDWKDRLSILHLARYETFEAAGLRIRVFWWDPDLVFERLGLVTGLNNRIRIQIHPKCLALDLFFNIYIQSGLFITIFIHKFGRKNYMAVIAGL